MIPKLEHLLEEQFQFRLAGISFFEWEEMSPLQRMWFGARWQRHQKEMAKAIENVTPSDGASSTDIGAPVNEDGTPDVSHNQRLLDGLQTARRTAKKKK